MMDANTLLIVGGTLALLLAITSFVLTQRNAWRVILLLTMALAGANMVVFVWSEMTEGWSSFRLFLFWLTALLPPLIGLSIGAAVGAVVNWRIDQIRPTHGKAAGDRSK